MFIDASAVENNKTIHTDVCIVGAGVAGISAALEFLDSESDVVILESGNFEPNPELQSLNSGENVGLKYYDLDRARTRAFGGTSHRWHVEITGERLGVRLRAMDKIDFEERDWVPYSGWPFGKEHLDPYYERAHETCKIGPYSYEVGDWEDKERTPRLPFVNGNINTTIFHFARRDVFYNDYRNELELSQNIATYLNATVLKVNANENARKVKDVLVSTLGGNRFTVQANYYVLALGGLETPRLLLLSDDVMNCGLGNQNDMVGRFFMEHPHLWNSFYFPSEPDIFVRSGLYKVHDRYGIPIMGKLTLAEEVLRQEKLLNFTTSIHPVPMLSLKRAVQSMKIVGSSVMRGRVPENYKNHIKNVVSNFDAMAYAGLRKLVDGDKEKWYGAKSKYHGFKLNIMAEQVPDPESRVMLDTKRDKFGQNKIKLDWKLTSADIRSIRRALEILDGELAKSGLGRLQIELEGDIPPADIHGGWHHMGTTRMHVDPKYGVVDEDCKIHGIENLFVAGASVYPTVGYANPTLTTVALAVRLADHIKKLSNR